MTTTALIIGDLQAGIVDNYPFAAGVLPVVERVLPAARAAGIPVIFIRFGLRASGLDVAAGNQVINTLRGAGTLFHEESPETLVHPRIEPLPGEAVILKRRASAFSGTDLDRLLRAQRVDSIVLAGVATGAMVAATFYDAADRDYRLTVLSDACADGEPDVHDFLVNRVFPARGADVLTGDEWAARL
ncbi:MULTISPECIES: cysteine hydrolase family protein [Streptosporangium]|uniref:Nicotinamidase-related amidase n=1 Tax=Streptosporangium brasiliense TaxID=47480 RepID=A0ABT9RFW6_9ACTN|nr:cysteine hydrolase [Streptosporangium brasiliense]MDP9868157.1 nicotinamidase-related amidase [Streptosporangium brasiliense]